MDRKTSRTDKASKNASRPGRRRSPSWAGSVGKVVYNLAVHRGRLRWAARHAGDPQTAQQLQRLARRRKGDVKEIVRTAPPNAIDAKRIATDEMAPHSARQLALANEIATLAAALRSNRKVRAAIERATNTTVPAPLAAKLARVAADLEIEAGVLNQQLRSVAVVDIDPVTARSTEIA